MKTRSFLLSVVLYLLTVPVFPQGFSYQAVVRNSGGTILSNQNVGFRFSILQGSSTGTVEYSETHDLNTDSQGLVTLVIGSGSVMSGSFTGIDWSNGTHYLKVELDPSGGSSYTVSETKRIQPVAYALYSGISDSISPGRVEVKGDATQNDEKALFEVKRSDGQTVFAVYPEGVRVYVKDEPGKGSKGGFAVGGFDPGKGITDEYLRVTPDSVRVYVAPGAGKGSKGGFAVGGFDPGKGLDDEYLRVTPDSVRIYIQDRETGKGSKGGFAVGGYDPAKGLTGDYFNVSGKTEAEVIHGEARVMWYPIKEAFRAGNVLIESQDSVGTNSWASGYRSKAIGNWSQALGYQATAREDYSTAIGKNATAGKVNSFAFGEDAKAINQESYAIGRGALASGYRSFAFGSAGKDSTGSVTGVAYAKGNYSFAIGQGSRSIGTGSFAIGLADTAKGGYSTAIGYLSSSNGEFSTSIGYFSKSKGRYSVAMGTEANAKGQYSAAIGSSSNATGYLSVALGPSAAIGDRSVAIGSYANANGYASVAFGDGTFANGEFSFASGDGTKASGQYSVAMGRMADANGTGSVAIGNNITAPSGYETVVGRYNTNYTPVSITGWDPSDRLFVIGNGAGGATRSNAVTVLKNGNLGIGTSNPSQKLHVNGDIRLEGGGIQNLSGGVGIGFTSTGWYSDVGNLATRIPSATGDLYVQTPGGTSTYLRVGPGIGGMELFVGKAVFDNSVGIATSSVGSYKLYVNGNAYCTGTWEGSDLRWKKNILPLNNLLSGIDKLIPVSFEWRRDEYPGINFDEGTQIGLIAQEVEKIFPLLVKTDDNGYKAVSYEKLAVILLAGMKEQQQQIDELKSLVYKLTEK